MYYGTIMSKYEQLIWTILGQLLYSEVATNLCSFEISENITRLTFICSKSTIETLEKREICSKLTTKTPERHSGVLIVNLKHISTSLCFYC